MALLFLRSALFNLLLLLWTLLFGLATLPLLLLPRRKLFAVARFWSRGIALLLGALCGLTYEVRGAERLPPGPFLLAAKHQSAWETLLLPLMVREPVFVLKRELLFLPFVGWYLKRLDMIAVNRAAGAKAMRRLLKEARRRAMEGRTLIIFPEGTRTTPGQHTHYQPGIFGLYRDLELPVVPAALNSGCFWGRRSFLKRPGRVIVSFLPPLPPGLPRETFLPGLQEAIETESLRLAAATPGCLAAEMRP